MRVSGLENCALLKIALNPHRLNRSARNKNSVNVFTLWELIHHTACTCPEYKEHEAGRPAEDMETPGQACPHEGRGAQYLATRVTSRLYRRNPVQASRLLALP